MVSVVKAFLAASGLQGRDFGVGEIILSSTKSKYQRVRTPKGRRSIETPKHVMRAKRRAAKKRSVVSKRSTK